MTASAPLALEPPGKGWVGRCVLATRRWCEGQLSTLIALAITCVAFGAFVAAAGHNPFAVYSEMYRGAFGTWFSFQNSLLRAAPLMLTGLCTALPARLGLVVIGGEGALVIGGMAAAATAAALRSAPPALVIPSMMLGSMLAGGAWIGAAGALRALRGVNETIGSLLLSYIGIALFNHLVEGPFRDPASLNKPSTPPIGEANMLGNLPGLDVHAGLAFGICACLGCHLLMEHTVFGFSARVVGGNPRAARLSGLRVPSLIIITCALAGAAAGLAGMVEVAAIHGSANASLMAGYGYAGILVAFVARHDALAILPVALLLGGISASGGLLQRTFGLPNAAVDVLQGIA
ncbi:MAG TPA: ABC transporter permease, partial [Polyangiaceae bacterium]|nr:ABC transporter permease [Polyangiaceae bacterium]